MRPKTALVIVDVQLCFTSKFGSLNVPGGLEVVQAINQLRKEQGGNFSLVVLTKDFHNFGHVSFASAHEHGHEGDAIHLKYTSEKHLCNCSWKGCMSDDCVACNSTVQVHHVMQRLWPEHCVHGAGEADIHPALTTKPTDIVIAKGTKSFVDAYSAFYDNSYLFSTRLCELFYLHGITRVLLTGVAFEHCVTWTAKDSVLCGFDTHIYVPGVKGISMAAVAESIAELRHIGVTMLEDSLQL